jgi:hypothetical protein
MISDETVIVVRRQWNDRARMATVRWAAVSGLRWDSVSGGVQAPAPQPFVHGYIWCDDVLAGELAHSCRHGPPPHEIKVCLTKKDNSAVWEAIARVVGPRPARVGRTKLGR